MNDVEAPVRADIPAEIGRTIVDPKSYAELTKLTEAFAWLRRHEPVARIETPGFGPFWAVTKHAEIMRIGRDKAIFHNGDRSTVLSDLAGEKKVQELVGGPHLVRTIVHMDDPDHAKYRQLTQSWFMPSQLKRLEPQIRALARQAVDEMAAKGGECDFASDVAALYPLRVIMLILGLPPEDEPRMLRLTQELFGNADPDMTRGKEGMEDPTLAAQQLFEVFMDFSAYFRKVTEDRRANPREDVSTVIANGKIDGAEIGDFEAMSYYTIIAAAGHDTTSSSTAGAIGALCEFPGEFAKVKADLGLIPGLVEESVRWVTPVKHFMRTATEDTESMGRRIAKGDWLMLCYLSGNRDEEVFEAPEVFRVDREPNRHLGFGYGPHLCLGQHMAKMEMRILFEELIPRLKSIEFAGTPTNTASNFVSGPKSLPVRYRF
jgi:cytochrome P450